MIKKIQMKKAVQLFVFLLALLASNDLLIAQTGPGGIGNSTGTNGPKNILWLDAGDLVLTNNDPVSGWADKSGNGNDLSSSLNDPNDPLYITNQINSLPVVRFSASAGTGTKLIRNPFNNFAADNVTSIIVYQSTDVSYGLLSYAISAADNNTYLIFNNNNDITAYIEGSTQASGQNLSSASFNTSFDFISR